MVRPGVLIGVAPRLSRQRSRHGCLTLTWSPLADGFLTGKYTYAWLLAKHGVAELDAQAPRPPLYPIRNG